MTTQQTLATVLPYFKRDDSLMDAFVRFCKLQIASHDGDAEYVTLKQLYHGLSQERALWHSFMYMAYMNPVSAYIALETIPWYTAFTGDNMPNLPINTERRGLRGGRINRHMQDVCIALSAYPSIFAFLTQGFTDDKRHNWIRLGQTIETIHGNGRWASYKMREVLFSIHAFPIEPTDMDHANSTGPRQALAYFYPEVKGNTAAAISILDEQGELLSQYLVKQGIATTIEQLETLLCNFHSLVNQNYYVGHDIDLLQEQILFSDASQALANRFWSARAAVFPRKYLGEFQHWSGIDRARNKLFHTTGVVYDRDQKGHITLLS